MIHLLCVKLIYAYMSLDHFGGRSERRREDRPGRMEGFCYKESIHHKEYDSSIFKVRQKFYSYGLILFGAVVKCWSLVVYHKLVF